MSSIEHFEQAAAAWDQNDWRVQLAHSVATAISSRMALSKNLDVLDFGCGTGLVTLELVPRIGSIAAADTSPAMLKVLAGKSQAAGIQVDLIQLDPDGSGSLGGPYDLIVSSMTLHHILDVPELFRRFRQHLKPGGRVALADLDEEDGSFHGEMPGVHHTGFKREHVRAWLETTGFRGIQFSTAVVTCKEGKEYSVFLVTAESA